MGFFDIFSNNAETKEQHNVIELRSRYYKSSYKKIKAEIEGYCAKENIKIKHIDDNHNEIFIQTNKYHMIISIVQLNPLESSVDIKVQTYRILGMNMPKKLIYNMYAVLNSKLTFKGTNLHP